MASEPFSLVFTGCRPRRTTLDDTWSLIVDTKDGHYFADVGFGGYLLDAPLELIPNIAQRSPTSNFRFERTGELYILQVELSDTWHNVYQFTTEPAYPIDFEMANWYNSAHPQSRFRTNLMINRLTPTFGCAF